MSRSLIQTVNQSQQNVNANSVIPLGTVLRRFGCNCRLSGDSIIAMGDGYYKVDANVSVAPTEAGAVTVAIYSNGNPITGAIAYGSVDTAGNSVTLPIETTIRQRCCGSAASLTVVLIEGAGVVRNIGVRVEKA